MLIKFVYSLAIILFVAGCSDSRTDPESNTANLPSTIVEVLQANTWKVSSINTIDGVSIPFTSRFNYTATYYQDVNTNFLHINFGCPEILVKYESLTGVIKHGPIINTAGTCGHESPTEFDHRLLIQQFFNKTTLTLERQANRIKLVNVDNSSIVLEAVVELSGIEVDIDSELRHRHWVLRSYDFVEDETEVAIPSFPLSLFLTQLNPDWPFGASQTGTMACTGSHYYRVTPYSVYFTTVPGDLVPCMLPPELDQSAYFALVLKLTNILDNVRWGYEIAGDSLVLRSDQGDVFSFSLATQFEISEIESVISTLL